MRPLGPSVVQQVAPYVQQVPGRQFLGLRRVAILERAYQVELLDLLPPEFELVTDYKLGVCSGAKEPVQARDGGLPAPARRVSSREPNGSIRAAATDRLCAWVDRSICQHHESTIPRHLVAARVSVPAVAAHGRSRHAARRCNCRIDR